MQDDSVRQGIGGNNQPDPIDDTIPSLAIQQSPLKSIPASRVHLGNVGQSTIYAWMADGEFEIVKLGSRTFLTVRSLDAFIARNTRRTVSAELPKPVRNPAAPKIAKRKLVPGKQQKREARPPP
jgi:hypothetical protein